MLATPQGKGSIWAGLWETGGSGQGGGKRTASVEGGGGVIFPEQTEKVPNELKYSFVDCKLDFGIFQMYLSVHIFTSLWKDEEAYVVDFLGPSRATEQWPGPLWKSLYSRTCPLLISFVFYMLKSAPSPISSTLLQRELKFIFLLSPSHRNSQSSTI